MTDKLHGGKHMEGCDPANTLFMHLQGIFYKSVTDKEKRESRGL